MKCSPALFYLALPGCSVPGGNGASDGDHRHRFFDTHGSSLEVFDSIWKELSAFFESDEPAAIVVAYKAEGPSLFDPQTDTVKIQLPGDKSVVAHEAAHLFIGRLTGQVSTTQPLRFVDEGLAELLQQKLAGSLDDYRRASNAVAASELKRGRLSLEQLQNWKRYRAELGSALAYPAGSSFVFFVLDEFGKSSLLALLRDLARTESLAVSCQNVLGRSAQQLVAVWHGRLDEVSLQEMSMAPQPASRRIASLISGVDLRAPTEHGGPHIA